MEDSRIQPYFLVVLLCVVGALVFFILEPFLVPLIMAAIFAVMFRPLYLHLTEFFRGQEAFAALATVFLSMACIVIPLILVGGQIVVEARDLYLSLSGETGHMVIEQAVKPVLSWVSAFVPNAEHFSEAVTAGIDTYTKQVLSFLIEHAGSLFASATKLLISLFLFLIALYYLLRDGVRLKQVLVELSPFNDQDDEAVFSRLESVVSSVVRGNLTIAFIQGVLSAVGFTLFGVPNSILWGVVAMIGALIPGFGTSLVIFPAIVYLFVVGHTTAGIGLLIWGVVAVGLIDNFLGPRLMGHRAGLHPLLVLLSVIGGIGFFGPVGIFLGPLSVALLLSLFSLYSSFARS